MHWYSWDRTEKHFTGRREKKKRERAGIMNIHPDSSFMNITLERFPLSLLRRTDTIHYEYWLIRIYKRGRHKGYTVAVLGLWMGLYSYESPVGRLWKLEHENHGRKCWKNKHGSLGRGFHYYSGVKMVKWEAKTKVNIYPRRLCSVCSLCSTWCLSIVLFDRDGFFKVSPYVGIIFYSSIFSLHQSNYLRKKAALL